MVASEVWWAEEICLVSDVDNFRFLSAFNDTFANGESYEGWNYKDEDDETDDNRDWEDHSIVVSDCILREKVPSSVYDEIDMQIREVDDGRPRRILRFAQKNGYEVSTDDLSDMGEIHGRRGIQDIIEWGFDVERFRKDGRQKTINAWRIIGVADDKERRRGRKNTNKHKKTLIRRDGGYCRICWYNVVERLQVDHVCPVIVGGDENTAQEGLMLLCPRCQAKKAKTCKGCTVGNNRKCLTCYYGNPDDYDHIAGRLERRYEIIFSEDEVQLCDNSVSLLLEHGIDPRDAMKEAILEVGNRTNGDRDIFATASKMLLPIMWQP